MGTDSLVCGGSVARKAAPAPLSPLGADVSGCLLVTWGDCPSQGVLTGMQAADRAHSDTPVSSGNGVTPIATQGMILCTAQLSQSCWEAR